MRTFACMLLVLGVASAQNAEAPATTAAGPDAAPATATAPAAASGATTKAVGGGATSASLGAAFFGPGIDNPTAISPNPQILQLMKNYLQSTPNTSHLRVFVDTNGRMHFTNQFGQETEVLHPVYGDLNELFQDPIELQERMTEFRQQGLDEAIRRCQTDLQAQYFNNPSAFTPGIFSGLTNPAAGVAGGAAGAGAGAGAGPRVVLA